MTPEEAKRLLDKVKENCPLPWEIGIDRSMAGAEYQVIVYNGNETYDDNLAYAAGYGGEVAIDPDAIDLVAAAPALAEIVAGMRYEYAVQVNDREWVRENDEGHFVLTGDPMRALRLYHPVIAASIAKGASAHFSCECRVVSRLVSTSEVVPDE